MNLAAVASHSCTFWPLFGFSCKIALFLPPEAPETFEEQFAKLVLRNYIILYRRNLTGSEKPLNEPNDEVIATQGSRHEIPQLVSKQML